MIKLFKNDMVKTPRSKEQSIRQELVFEAKKWEVSHYMQLVEF